MAYNGLTNLGAEHLAKCLANKTGITFTKIKVGNGNISSEKTGQTTTELYGFKKELEILAKEQVETALKLTVLLNNIDLNAGFYIKEIGVYVQDGEREILYWYINKDNPSYLPDKNTPSNHRYNLYLEVSPIQTTIVNFTGEGLLADKKYVNDSIKNFDTENKKNLELKFNKGQLPITFTSAETILKALQGNTGIKFDDNLLYLNDTGTKKKGFCYLDKLTDGIFECIQETTTTVNGATYFKNFSNKENSDRLSNLIKVKNLHRIDSNFDFNNLIKRGVYSANTYKNDCPKNFPINENLGMNILVIECGTSSYLTQLVLTSREHFFRMYDIGLFQWTKWQKYSLIEV